MFMCLFLELSFLFKGRLRGFLPFFVLDTFRVYILLKGLLRGSMEFLSFFCFRMFRVHIILKRPSWVSCPCLRYGQRTSMKESEGNELLHIYLLKGV